jgi:YD repeat-containing protein
MKHRSESALRIFSLSIALGAYYMMASLGIAQVASVTPCMERGKPCERPGDPYLGDNSVTIAPGVGTYNSQSSDALYYGQAVTPRGGYLKFTAQDVILVDSSGYQTLFIAVPAKKPSSGSLFLSVNRLSGDRREITVGSAGANLYDPLSGERVEFSHRSGSFGFPTAWKNSFGHTVYSMTYQGGVPVSAIDQMEGVTRYSSSGGRVTSIKYPMGEEVRLAYDSSGRVVELALGERTLQKFRYDESGKMTETEDSEGNLTLFAYKGSVLIGTGDGKGSTTVIDYDAKGVTVRRNDFGSKSSERAEIAMFGGRALPMKLLVSPTNHTPNLSVASIARDKDGNVISFTDSGERSTKFSYVDGLLTSVSSDTGGESRKLDALGRPLEVVKKDPKGVATATARYSYEADRISGLTVLGPKGSVISVVSYSYDLGPDQTVLAMRETRKGTTTFQYDALSRIRMAEGARGGIFVERNQRGELSAISINGVRTTIDAAYSGGKSRTAIQGGGIATSESTDLLGTSSTSTTGDLKGRDVTVFASARSGNQSQGNVKSTAESTTRGAGYSQEASAGDAIYARNWKRVTGRGKPGAAPTVSRPRRSFGGSGGGNGDQCTATTCSGFCAKAYCGGGLQCGCQNGKCGCFPGSGGGGNNPPPDGGGNGGQCAANTCTGFCAKAYCGSGSQCGCQNGKCGCFPRSGGSGGGTNPPPGGGGNNPPPGGGGNGGQCSATTCSGFCAVAQCMAGTQCGCQDGKCGCFPRSGGSGGGTNPPPGGSGGSNPPGGGGWSR